MDYNDILNLVVKYLATSEALIGAMGLWVVYVTARLIVLYKAVRSLQEDNKALLKAIHISMSEQHDAPPPDDLVTIWRKRMVANNPGTLDWQTYRDKLAEFGLQHFNPEDYMTAANGN
jgi:hypothetical protein